MAKDDKQHFLDQLGANLKKARIAKGLSTRGLSALCSIDYADISRIENGKINISIYTLLELAEALEVKPKKLMDIEV